MMRNLMALPCLLALVLACGEGRNDGQDTGAAAGTGAETGALPADTGYTGAGIDDTTAPTSDTAAPSNDTAAPVDEAVGGDSANQDQSGVTDTESGQSELGGEVTETTPDAGEPVTAKGDTVGVGGEGATSDTAQ